MTTATDVEIRRATPGDDEAVLDLMAASLGWAGDDRFAALFRWKHVDNRFGRSPAWVAESAGRVVGFRTFMRWAFARDGRTVSAVRAVDTATHPDFRGRGIFSKLTADAVAELRDDGVEFVFNTPNDQSRPGYLKLGWQPVGRLPVAVRPRGAAGGLAMVRARTPAQLWSLPCDVGEPAAALAAALPDLPPPQPDDARLRTLRDPSYRVWRYGFEPLHYRVVVAPDGMDEGFAVFRLRARGDAVEAALVEIVAVSARVAARLTRALVRRTGADYAIQLGPGAAGAVPLPRQGPVLFWRGLADPDRPQPRDWALSLGDVELF